MAKILVKNLMQQYLYGTTGVNNLSFETEDSFVVFGEEEAGKTSLLEVLAGKREAFSGQIIYSPNREPRGENTIFVRERDGLFRFHSVFFNLAYPLKLRKIQKAEILQTVQKIAKNLGLFDVLQKKVWQLSGYQRAVLALARCFLRKVDFIFIDAVQKGLSGEEREQLMKEIYPKICGIEGCVKIFATDNYHEAMFLAQNGVVLHFGITEQVGRVSDFYNLPQTLTVFRLTHGALTTENGTLQGDTGEIATATKRIMLDPSKIKEGANGDVLVATDPQGITHIYTAQDEKLAYFD